MGSHLGYVVSTVTPIYKPWKMGHLEEVPQADP